VRFATAVPLSLLLLLVPRAASAFCRTTTCDPPASFVPTATQCEPAGWAADCKGQGLADVPLWWASSCVSFDVQQAASKDVTFDQADAAWTAAFAAWSGATCAGGTTPSITGHDLGAVACSEVGYQQDAANQHVLVFRDGAWPYPNGDLTIALTTVNYDRNTGEIFDADIEINSGQHKVLVTTAPSPGTFDLQAVLTHETGHFLGLAHSPDASAVMFPSDEGSDTKKRMLATDDVSAICTAYPAGRRAVATSVDPSGFVAAGACDPTPRHGFSSACATPQPSKSGCSTAPEEDSSGGAGLFGAALALAAGLSRRARVRA
jgi:MYXO-CTERM domain-containing protein